MKIAGPAAKTQDFTPSRAERLALLPGPGPLCSSAEFQQLRDFLYTNAGISIPEKKQALVQGRLAKRLESLGLRSYRQYCHLLLEADPEGRELSEFVNALTTTRTEFFREQSHFETLQKTCLPERARARGLEIRIWSAACSTGEEPYSLAAAATDWAKGFSSAPPVRVLASDLNSRVLDKARRGRYPAAALATVPPLYRTPFFRPVGGPRGAEIEVDAALRRAVEFRRFNLMTSPYPFRRPFDVIFCRNVFIYFDRESRQHVLSQMEGALAPGGFFIIGHAESLLDVRHDLVPLGAGVFQKS